MRDEPRELELKVQLSRSDIARLNRRLSAARLASAEPSKENLKSIYFDTPGLSLREMGVSLRLRRQGKGWIQTLKADKAIRGGVSNPIEIEVPVSDGIPDIEQLTSTELGRAVKKAIGEAPLRPLFKTDVRRTRHNIRANGSEMELALDEGELKVKSKTQKLCEAELELKSGHISGLLETAETIFAESELELSTRSKSDLGYDLLLGRKSDAGEGERQDRTEIRPSDSCLQAFSSIFVTIKDQIIANSHAVLDSPDARGPHQLRIGLRKLRTAVRALRPLAKSSSLERFDGLAGKLARCVGTLRDVDVLMSSVCQPLEPVVPEKSGMTELHQALLQHHQAKYKEVRSQLAGPEWSRLQLYMALWPLTLRDVDGIQQPIVDYSRRILRARWKKVRRLGNRLEELSPEARHDMRKALKQLRYLSEFFAPLYAKRSTRRFINKLKQLQDVFGYLNDVYVARQLPALPELSTEAMSTAQFVLGWHEAEAQHVWRQAGRAWRRLKKTNKFWK
jgi:inorganic triphosphatase YgiF